MDRIIQFIVDNWQWFSSIAVSAISFILLLVFKRKPIVKYIDEYYQELVNYIQQAEDIFGSGHGDDKKKYVLSSFMSLHPSYRFYDVSDAIEDILSCPTKKGGK